MKINKKGFTLLELLVVVIIIGVLAAIALPQYKKAVEKTRLREALVLGKHIRDLEETYYLVNGNYTMSFAELGMDIPAKYSVYNSGIIYAKYFQISLETGVNNRVVYYYKSDNLNFDLALFFYYKQDLRKGKTTCNSYTDHGRELCKTLNL